MDNSQHLKSVSDEDLFEYLNTTRERKRRESQQDMQVEHALSVASRNATDISSKVESQRSSGIPMHLEDGYDSHYYDLSAVSTRRVKCASCSTTGDGGLYYAKRVDGTEDNPSYLV